MKGGKRKREKQTIADFEGKSPSKIISLAVSMGEGKKRKRKEGREGDEE